MRTRAQRRLPARDGGLILFAARVQVLIPTTTLYPPSTVYTYHTMTSTIPSSSKAGPSTHLAPSSSVDDGRHPPVKTTQEIQAKERHDIQKRVHKYAHAPSYV